MSANASSRLVGTTALHVCGSLEVTKVLLDNGADVDAVDWDGMSALDHACKKSGKEDVLLHLLHNDAKLRDNTLMYACMNGNRMLLGAGASASCPRSMFQACMKGNAEVMRVLASRGLRRR